MVKASDFLTLEDLTPEPEEGLGGIIGGFDPSEIAEYAKAFKDVAKAATELINAYRGAEQEAPQTEVGGNRSFKKEHDKLPKGNPEADFTSQAKVVLETILSEYGDIPVSTLLAILKGEDIGKQQGRNEDRGEGSSDLRVEGRREDDILESPSEPATPTPDNRPPGGIQPEEVPSVPTEDDRVSRKRRRAGVSDSKTGRTKRKERKAKAVPN